MKTPTKLALTATLAAAYALFGAACSKEESHDHDHDHDGHEHHDDDGHDHEKAESDDHKDASHDDHDHDHDHAEAGPNGGRILHAVEPHLEFFVTDARTVQIAAVDDDGNVQPIGEQAVTVIGGDRSNPTVMKLAKEGDVLISDTAFPEGNDFPIVVQIKTTPDAKAETVKFNLNLADCPTCEYKEYACTCDHEH